MNAVLGNYGEVNKGWTADDAKGFIKILSNSGKIYEHVNTTIMIQAGIIGGADIPPEN